VLVLVQVVARHLLYCRHVSCFEVVGQHSMLLKYVTSSWGFLKSFIACLSGIFIIQVDDYGHVFGPNSVYVDYAIRQVDAQLVRVLDAVEKAGDINLMLFSDHGFAERLGGPDDATSGLINVLDYINETDWEYIVGVDYTPHPTLQIWPKYGNEDWVSLTL